MDFALREGERVAVVGRSGAGKSTLLAVIAGIEPARRGRVVVDGHDLVAMDEDARAIFRRRHVGILFQAFHLVPSMTAEENVALVLELEGRRDALERARTLLDEVGLAHRLRHYPHQLSGGEQQRVALARALALEPPLLLADEPTGNLDTETGERVMDLLFGLARRRGSGLVLVTHDAELAARCDRVLRMEAGRIVGTVPRERVAAT
ncbi:putative ABC transporter ATP-binding protein [bacterium HR39]|nr:putative ABC transporter ATP-binding protein [bacterium HR39]